jgi:hypothetical protein
LQGAVLSDLARPRDVERVAALVREEDVASVVVCGPDPDRHHAAIARFAAAGLSRVYIHQIGPDQEEFFDFYEREILPRFVQSSDEEGSTWTPTTPSMSTHSAARAAAHG